MKRIEFSELPKLHAICNRWMRFFLFTFGRHFKVLARLQKNVHSAERALLQLFFPMPKIAKFCCDLERFPELGTTPAAKRT